MLNLLDYNLIQERKIKIIGFSDTTAIILAIYKMTGMNVYYGQALLKDYDENNFVNKTNALSIKDLILKNLHNYSYSNPKYYWDLQTD
ncbi:LD-carboxypeptidase [bacterium]|nr:LD-carboxypeptidase [bacterium]